MNETLLYPFKPTPDDLKYRLAYDLLNRINFSLQIIVHEQEFVNEILYNSPQSSVEILETMGTDGEKWLTAYNETSIFVEKIAALNNKTLEDISATGITNISETVELGEVSGSVQLIPDTGSNFPFLWGTVEDDSLDSSSLATKLTNTLIVKSDQTVNLKGTGKYIYFAYPIKYKSLKSILDPNSFNITSDFTFTTSSVTGLRPDSSSWDKMYNVYRLTDRADMDGDFRFNFK